MTIHQRILRIWETRPQQRSFGVGLNQLCSRLTPQTTTLKTHINTHTHTHTHTLAFKLHGKTICQQIWKTQQWPQDWKSSVFIPISKKGSAKECSNYCTIALISHARKSMLKILQARLQQYMSQEPPDVQAGFKKGRGTRDQIANICWVIEKAREFRKTSTSVSLTTLKPLTVWITRNCRKFLKRWEYQNTLPASREICMQVKKQWLEPDMEK